MLRESLYIILITIFFVWGGVGLIYPAIHRKFANLALYTMGAMGVLVILAIAFEILPQNDVVHFGFAQALVITVGLALILNPILIGDKTIITYFAPFWYLLLTLVLTASFIFPPTHKVYLANATFEIHFLLSMLAYAMFTIWAIVAIIVIIQSHRLHNPKSVEIIRELPPLMAIEKQSLWLGRITFVFLSAVLITGLIYSNMSIGKVMFTHKFIFALLTWVGVCIIVYGQTFRNWRGKWINISVLICYGLVFLAYIGYRFVLEILLNRGI